MKKIVSVLLLSFIFMLNDSLASDKPATYHVKKLKGDLTIDAKWDKAQWKKIKEIPISNFMGDLPAFQPVVRAKMMYDKENLYLNFI